jgi:DNA-binding YbaB/EbfC family protein
MKGMNDLLRQAQLMQNRMAKLQEELGAREVEASSGGGMVKVVANGKQQILSITMEKEAVNAEDVEMLQDLTLAAVNEALRLSREMMEREMSELTGGLKIPGIM